MIPIDGQGVGFQMFLVLDVMQEEYARKGCVRVYVHVYIHGVFGEVRVVGRGVGVTEVR